MRAELRAFGVAGLMSLTGYSAQPAVQAAGAPATVVEQITAAEHAWARGIIETDTVALGRLLAPELVLTGIDSTEPPFPRDKWMIDVGAKRVSTDSVAIDSLESPAPRIRPWRRCAIAGGRHRVTRHVGLGRSRAARVLRRR